MTCNTVILHEFACSIEKEYQVLLFALNLTKI